LYFVFRFFYRQGAKITPRLPRKPSASFVVMFYRKDAKITPRSQREYFAPFALLPSRPLRLIFSITISRPKRLKFLFLRLLVAVKLPPSYLLRCVKSGFKGGRIVTMDGNVCFDHVCISPLIGSTAFASVQNAVDPINGLLHACKTPLIRSTALCTRAKRR